MTEAIQVHHGIDHRFDGDKRVDHLKAEPVCVCGDGMFWRSCWDCGGEGGIDGEQLMEIDPNWYDEDDWLPCMTCRGKTGWWTCETFWTVDDQ